MTESRTSDPSPAAATEVRSAPSPTSSDEARSVALLAAQAAMDKKAVGVQIIDVAGRVDYADFLILMTGTSDRHVSAIAKAVDQDLSRAGHPPLSIEGLGKCDWVLLDFVDVVVHVFAEDARSLYDLDGLWMDASRVPLPDREPLPDRK